MAEYAKGYESKTAWMHQSGVAEIRAAVIAQAVTDYVEASKMIIGFSGEITGKNVDRFRQSKLNRWTYQHRKYKRMTLEEYLMRETFRSCQAAEELVTEVEKFFTSQVFLEFCDNSTGELILERAREFLRDWAEDRNNGKWSLPTRALDDPQQAYHEIHKYDTVKGKRGRKRAK